MLGGSILDQADDLKPPLRQVWRLESSARRHLDSTDAGRGHRANLPPQIRIVQVGVEKPHRHRPILRRRLLE
jgi:hypothetical protein